MQSDGEFEDILAGTRRPSGSRIGRKRWRRGCCWQHLARAAKQKLRAARKKDTRSPGPKVLPHEEEEDRPKNRGVQQKRERKARDAKNEIAAFWVLCLFSVFSLSSSGRYRSAHRTC